MMATGRLRDRAQRLGVQRGTSRRRRPRLAFFSGVVFAGLMAASADTFTNTTTAAMRTGTWGSDTAYLSLYDGQRSWIDFNLSGYSGQAVLADAVLSVRNAYIEWGGAMANVTLGVIDNGATWPVNHSTAFTNVSSGVVNPSGNLNNGDNATWTIPWYLIEKWSAADAAGQFNGLKLSGGAGSTVHFDLGGGAYNPTLVFSTTTGVHSDGVWTGGSGHWTDSGNWSSGTVARGMGQSATFGGSGDVTVTMDADRTIGSLAFDNANHTIAAGSGRMALSVASGSPTLSVGSGRTAAIGATILGLDGLTKTGGGTLVLSGANSYGGQTDIQTGTLVAASSSALGLGGHDGATMSWIKDGATLALQGNVSLNEHFHVWGSGVGGLGAVRNLSGDNALTDTYALRSGVTVGVDAGSLTVGGFYEDGGSFGLTKAGPGTLTVSGASSHSGGTTVHEGILKAGHNQALGASGGAIVVHDGATLDLAAAELWGYTQAIQIEGEGVGGLGAIYKSSTYDGGKNQLRSITLAGDASIGGVSGARIDIGRGDWGGALVTAPIHIDGQGHTLSLVGNVYFGILAGATNLAGFVIGPNATAAPHANNSFGAAPVTIDGGTLSPWGGHTFSNRVTVTANGGHIDNQGKEDTYTGPIQIDGPVQINTIAYGNINLHGNITGAGALTKIGGYSLMLAGDNSGFGGSVSNNQSNLFFQNAAAGSAAAAWTVAGGATIAASVHDANPTIHLGSLAGDGRLANGGSNSVATFRIGALNADTTFGGTIQDQYGGVSNSVAIAKVGTGTLTLTGPNTYSGGTTVDAGTLLVNSSAGSGAVTVHGGALGGTGAIAGAIGLTAGTLAPGNSAGTLTANGGLALSASATYEVEIDWDGSGTLVGGVYYPTAGEQYDQVVIGGGQFAASNANLTVSLLNAYGPMENLAAFLIVAGAYDASTFGVSSVTNGSHAYSLHYGAYDGVHDGIWLVEVPEPSVLGLLALAGLAAAWRRRQGPRLN